MAMAPASLPIPSMDYEALCLHLLSPGLGPSVEDQDWVLRQDTE